HHPRMPNTIATPARKVQNQAKPLASASCVGSEISGSDMNPDTANPRHTAAKIAEKIIVIRAESFTAVSSTSRSQPQRRERRTARSPCEPLHRASACLRGFLFAIPRRRARLEREQKLARRARDLVDGGNECGLVGLRGLAEAAHLAHELERCCANLLLGDGRI